MRPEVEIRRLRTNAEYQECVRLQERVWGKAFSERVPLAILKVGQRIGGVTAGAFDESGRLVGFVFGLTGIERGRWVHWSDMLAVLPEARDQGIGQQLKEFQRAELVQLGVEVVYWTFDPLVARNAHLNINRLRGRVVEYVVEMYGSDTASELQRGLGTDRLVVAWRIVGNQTGVTPPQPATVGSEVVTIESGGTPVFDASRLAGASPRVTIPVPDDIGAVRDRSIHLATLWREATRTAFTSALQSGYHVVGFVRSQGDVSAHYLLDREVAESAHEGTG